MLCRQTKEMKTEKLFYSIGEVAELSGILPHVIRYWESKFRSITPKKSSGGKRLYKEKDVQEILLLKKLLRDEQYTFEGAREVMRGIKGPREQKAQSVMPETEVERLKALLREVRGELEEIRRELG